MSDAKLIGSCGIRFTEDTGEMGPSASLDPRVDETRETFAIYRDESESVSMTRDEVRDLIPLLISFVGGSDASSATTMTPEEVATVLATSREKP